MLEYILPQFITFTGVDDETDICGMRELSAQYPIEWGILFSRTRQGVDQRYPSMLSVTPIIESGLPLAAHLCGAYAQEALAWGEPPNWRSLSINTLKRFDRIQVNYVNPDPTTVHRFQTRIGKRCIGQIATPEFPSFQEIDWLYDPSGGTGVSSATLPPYPGRLAGYAGGIGPDNVVDIIKRINADGPYWIDMESKIRTDNRLDLKLCRAVCEAVYGQ